MNAARTLLAGLKVLELQAIGPVPFAGRLLADLGASVVRIHAPTPADLGRPTPSTFDVLSHHKRTEYLDLKDTASRDRVLAMLDAADVLIEGFRPGVLERLGLAPSALFERNPKLVVGRLSGWGATGPWSARAGHDINFLALTGALHAIGTRGTPVPPLNLVADFGGGAMHLLVGLLAALLRRAATGRGGLVETSITAGAHGLNGIFHGMLGAGEWTLEREANLLDGGAPYYRCYATSDGGFVAVGAIERRFFEELLKLTGLTEAIDVEQQHDCRSWPDMTAKLSAVFASRSRAEWTARALSCDACVTPVLDLAEASADPHNVANGWFRPGVVGATDVLRFSVT